MTRTECKTILERMIDEGHVPHLLVEYLADICSEKEQHVQSAWQDRGIASAWHALALAYQGASAKLQDAWYRRPPYELPRER